MESNVLKYIEGLQQIANIESQINPYYKETKRFVMQRLLELEKQCNEKGVQIAPNVCISDNFDICEIEVNSKGNITFRYNEYWAYGGHESGTLSLSYEELVTGNFDERIENLLKEKQERINNEKSKKLAEYNRMKNELEKMKTEIENSFHEELEL